MNTQSVGWRTIKKDATVAELRAVKKDEIWTIMLEYDSIPIVKSGELCSVTSVGFFDK